MASLEAASTHATRAPLGDCGVLWVVFAAHRTARVIREAYASAQLLQRTARPAYPTLLMANRVAREELSSLSAKHGTSPWSEARTLSLDRRLVPHGNTNKFARNDPRRAYLAKLSGLLSSGFNRTVYLDCDVFVIAPTLVHDLFERALGVAELAMPLDPGRAAHLAPSVASRPPWVSPNVGPPPLCSAVMAYRRAPAVHELFLGAARRLLAGGHANARQGDQEMIWFEWTARDDPGLRVLGLPEETYCPLESKQSPPRRWRESVWRTSWRRGVYTCAAVHGHAVAALVLAEQGVA